MEEAKSELGRIIQDREMRNVVLLVFANKQDVDGGESSNHGKPDVFHDTRILTLFNSHATKRRSSGPRPRQDS